MLRSLGLAIPSSVSVPPAALAAWLFWVVIAEDLHRAAENTSEAALFPLLSCLLSKILIYIFLNLILSHSFMLALFDFLRKKKISVLGPPLFDSMWPHYVP